MPEAALAPTAGAPVVRADLDAPALASLPPAARARLRELSERLWSQAGAVDAAPVVPASHLSALAEAGLYGVYAPVAEGGLGLDYGQVCAVVEELAAACVATTFLWAQHLRLLGAVLSPKTPAPWREEVRDEVISGRCKGGVVLTGLMPGPVRLAAEPEGHGWRLQGEAPWVSGWGIVDRLFVVARGPDNTTVEFDMGAREHPGLSVAPARLAALNATSTVSLRFEAVFMGAEQVLGVHPYEEAHQASEGLRLNGSFALGVAKRCCALLGPSGLDSELIARREQLDTASAEDMAAARAAACELAVRAAHALTVSRGSRAALAGDVAERSSREANVLLVFGSRPAIKTELLRRLNAG